MPDKICAFPKCGKKVRARGYCSTCYYRLARRGTLRINTQTQKWKHRLSNVNQTDKTATCANCGEVKIVRRGAHSKQWRCSVDANARSKERKRKVRQVKKDRLLDHCEICNSKNSLCWDHDHKTDLFRGTLCNDCNIALGLFKDDPNRCVAAANYLKRAYEQGSPL